MKPVVHGLDAAYRDRVDFLYFDVDDPATDDLKQQFGFVKTPLFVILDGNGDVVQEWAGSVPESDFITALDAVVEGTS